jgi:hypothetical protein
VGVYRGHAGIETLSNEFFSAFEDIQLDAHDCLGALTDAERDALSRQPDPTLWFPIRPISRDAMESRLAPRRELDRGDDFRREGA